MKKILLLLLLAVLTVGCASSKVTYKKAQNYDIPLERVYILNIFPEYQEEFAIKFKEEFSKYLVEAKIENIIYNYILEQNSLSLEDDYMNDVLKRKIEEFAPLHLMSISFKSKKKFVERNTGIPSSEKMKYEVIVRDMVTDKKVWVANVQAGTGNWDNQSDAAQKMAEKLMKSFLESGMVKGQVVLNN